MRNVLSKNRQNSSEIIFLIVLPNRFLNHFYTDPSNSMNEIGIIATVIPRYCAIVLGNTIGSEDAYISNQFH